jgi:hypothetical protein
MYLYACIIIVGTICRIPFTEGTSALIDLDSAYMVHQARDTDRTTRKYELILLYLSSPTSTAYRSRQEYVRMEGVTKLNYELASELSQVLT